MAVDSNLGAVVGAEGAVASIPGNDGRIAQAWVNVRGGLCVFAVYFWQSEGWTPRNEALLEAVVRQTKSPDPWLVACDANMCPEDFEKSLWSEGTPEEASTCRSKSPKAEWLWWRQAAKRKAKEKDRRRGGRGGQWRKKNQELNRPRSGCGHQGEGRRA